jgi:hypothetical protein
MQGEMDEEKAMGLGLPTDVTNAVAQQQMMGDVQGEQQAAMAQHQAELDAQAEKNKPATKTESTGTFGKLKQIL